MFEDMDLSNNQDENARQLIDTVGFLCKVTGLAQGTCDRTGKLWQNKEGKDRRR